MSTGDEGSERGPGPSRHRRATGAGDGHAHEAGHDDRDTDDPQVGGAEVAEADTPGWGDDPHSEGEEGRGEEAEPEPRTSWRDRDPLPAVLVLLTGLTGAADAVGFLALGQVFTANMTGNIVLLGFALAGAEDLTVSGHLMSLGAFLVGALVGGRLLALLEGWPRQRWMLTTACFNAVLVFVAALLAIGLPVESTGGLNQRLPVIAFLAVAMGVRNAVVHRLHVADLPVSVVTTTLTGLISDSALAGHANVRPLRRAAAVISMFGGALVGALLVIHLSATWTLLVVGVAAPLLALAYWAHPGGTNEPVHRTGRPEPTS